MILLAGCAAASSRARTAELLEFGVQGPGFLVCGAGGRVSGCTSAISSRRPSITNTRAEQKLPHTWIILVIVKQHLVQIGRIDGPTEYL